MDTLVVRDVITDSRSVVPMATPAAPETVLSPTPSQRPPDLPKDEADFQAYILDYFKGLAVPEEEVTPLLGEILTKAKKRCEPLLFFVSFTGAWERLADCLTLAIRDAALEAYVWNQRDSLTERFSKNRRYQRHAEDIAHNVMSRAVNAIRRGRRPQTLLKNWFSVVATSALTDHHRSENRQPRTLCLFRADDDNDRTPFHKLKDRELSPSDQTLCRITWEELAALKGQQVADACRYAAERHTHKQIAKKLRTTDRTVRRWLATGIPILERIFQKAG